VWITDLFIRRPVFAIVVNMLLVGFGIFGLTQLPIRDLPDISPPTLSVSTTLAGASAKEVESQITTILEGAISSVGSIDVISSTSSVGSSSIEVQFQEGTDLNEVANEVRAQINDVLSQLPTDTDTPVVLLSSASANPILYLALSSDSMDELELTDLANRQITPSLQIVSGVSSIETLGERDYAMRIWLDSLRMATLSVTTDDVTTAVAGENISLPAGALYGPTLSTEVTDDATLSDVTGFSDIMIRRDDNYIVRVGDVARVEIGAESEDSSVLANDKPAVALGVVARSDANPLTVASSIKVALPAIIASLPSSVSLEVVFDETIFIEASMDEVFWTVAEAILLVIVVIMLFLGSLRASLITLVTIPISLIATVGVLYMIGFSLNTFTLLALVLAVGLVVDDAIVDVENVQRHIDQGHTAIDAAFIGSREIGFAVVATTLTLVAVYAPVGLLPGTMGRLFVQFAVTLSIAVLFSGLVSRTLSPMMCSRILKAGKPSFLQGLIERVFENIAAVYERVLAHVIHARWITVLVAVIVGAIAVLYVKDIETTLAPEEDEGYLIAIFEGPQGSTLEYMEAQAIVVSDILSAVPEAANSIVMVGEGTANSGLGFLLLKPWDKRTRSAQEISFDLWPKFAALPGVRGAVVNPDPLGLGGGYPIELVVKSTGAYEDLADVADQIVAKARESGVVSAISSPLSFATPEIQVKIDRDIARELGIDAQTLARTLWVMLGGDDVTKFSWEDQLYEVIVELDLSDRGTVEDLNRIYLRDVSGTMVPLSTIATVQNTLTAESLTRFAQEPSTTLSAAPAGGLSVSAALAQLEAIATEIMPTGYALDYSGPTRQQEQSSGSTGIVVAFGFLTIFLVLGAQFESFRDPVIILAVAPLTLIAGAFGLKLLGGSINAYSGVGLVTLIGLIAKHGILITEFANQRRDEGEDKVKAVIDACSVRLRPILMTVVAAAAGAMPLLYASGAGANSRQQIGAVIVIGLLLGTFVSLFVVPAVYTMLSAKVRKPLVEPPEERSPGGHA
jgi:multidrug efflux pump